jgi:hypothetical protein
MPKSTKVRMMKARRILAKILPLIFLKTFMEFCLKMAERTSKKLMTKLLKTATE